MSEKLETQQEEIELTLTPTMDVKEEKSEAVVEEEKKKAESANYTDPISENKLNDKEKQIVSDFAKKINIEDSTTILQYGSTVQKKISDFSESALKNVKTKDLGEIGDLLGNLVVQLKDTDNSEEKKGFFASLFNRGKEKLEGLFVKYEDAEKNVTKIANLLEDHQITLMKDISMLDELYVKNQENIKELDMYILAGRRKLQEVREKDLPPLREKAQKTGLPEDAQKANDLEQAIVRFEKKLHDLELTRQVSIQMAPQIRLVQSNDTVMTEKIQSTLVNTIPLWKNQIVLSLGIHHSKQALEAQREVSEMTNVLLKKNAETLHQATVETAKESERGIVDLETLQHTNEELIQTLDEVLNIQKEGREKREAAEMELRRIENQLSTKLLEQRK
ncbi:MULTISPECIES: toxic anion resistance protein [Terrabacteria group]|uniref:toxic anion resistance protein n=1 Tax=Bacillati TaxID=1783272 RepID=UPI00193A5016|nr:MULTISPECIES: toxic anion resistance protein [Terrabacteria group]MBW9212555.1 toxic anion resistance protein [Trueperella sp. zg.1013]QRG86693.1 toxic anion resistance protein [Bulleidia sp. zg-1006]